MSTRDAPRGEGRDFIEWELEWGEYSLARFRRYVELKRAALAGTGHWGAESEEFADLLDAFKTDAMRPVKWWANP